MKWAYGFITVGVAGMGVLVVLSMPTTTAEERVSLDDLPAAVRAAIEKQAAGGSIVEVEKEVKGGEVFYEAEVLRDGKESDVLVSASGEFLGAEAEEDGDDDGDKDGNDDEDGENRVVFDDLPEPVRDTLNNAYKGTHFSSFSKEMEGGHEVFEAEYNDGESEHSLSLAADGNVLESEAEESYDSLPPAVRSAIDSEYAGATVEEAERVELTFYEVELTTADGSEVELKVLANGRLLDDED
jgi:uncharacterized membrane protein YkoI